MSQRSYCFDIEPIWGSHAPILTQALADLPAGSLVIEHGAGMYSSPLIARHDVRVICVEEAAGWRSWAQWLYGDRATLLSRAKEAMSLLAGASLVFIDGANRERGDLLKWALAAGAQSIVAHDTEDLDRYGYRHECFRASGYAVTSDSGTPRTTIWRKTLPA